MPQPNGVLDQRGGSPKLIVAETETAALREWLIDHRDLPLVTSSIGAVELQRRS